MNTTLLVNISGQTYQRLDIFEELPISVIIQQSDLADLTARRVPYSKTISIPDTDNNSKIFEHYYEVNGLDFNPLNKIPCVVQYRGTDIFRGILRLNAVITKGEFRFYEVYILGDVSDFFSEIKDYDLQELDWLDLQHQVTYDNIVLSWEAKANTNDGLLNGNVLYPLINYGLVYTGDTGNTPTFSYAFSGDTAFSTSGNPVTTDTFKPSIRVREVVNRIFDKSTYTLNSEFMDTDYFKSIYMDTFQNGKLGIEQSGDVTNQNIFKVYTNTSNQQSPIFTQTGNLEFYPINWRNEGDGGYDPLNNFTIGNTLQIAPLNEGYFRAPYDGQYYFNIRFNYSDPNFVLPGISKFYIVVNANSNLNNINIGSIYTSPAFSCDAFGLQQSADLYFDATLNLGDYVKVFILLDPASGINHQVKLNGFSQAGVTTPYPMWDLYTSPQVSPLNVDFSLGIANLNSADFLKSLITTFNLLVLQDEQERVINFIPYNWYYNESERPVQDWSERVDLNSDYRIEPLSFDLAKEVKWSYADTDNEFLPKQFFNQYDYVFGRYKFVTPNNIFTGDQDYVIPFGSVPTNGVPAAPNFIIPQYWDFENAKSSGRETPYATIPHLFFWCGNRYAYKDIYKTIPGYWYLASGSTAVQQTTYPCVSHLSSLDIQIPDLVSDLNFGGTFDFFGFNNNQPVQFTRYNIFDTWWSNYIDNIYSPETRRLTCRVFFNPIDVYETTLKDKVFVKDAFWTIERINEADLVNRKITEVSLIKNRIPYYKITPPAPVYALSGNTPYPSPQPAFVTICYVSQDKDDVCNETAPLSAITTFGTGTIENFDVVYYDSGTQMVKLPQGFYLKQQNIIGADTFVVIDNYGRILQQTC